MQALSLLRKATPLLFAATILCLVLPKIGAAQSRPTASRSSGIDLFGGFSDTDTAFYGTDRRYGGMAGIDFTQFRYIPNFSGRISPSLELRGTYTPGTPVSELSVQGGLKVAYNYHKLHPYGALRVGGGTIKFNPFFTPPGQGTIVYQYSSDSSFLFVYGGGVTYDILPRWSLMADYEHQSWNLGFNPEVKFTPQAVSVGVVYHLRLKGYR